MRGTSRSSTPARRPWSGSASTPSAEPKISLPLYTTRQGRGILGSLRGATGPSLHHHAPIQAPSQARGASANKVSRSQAHVRHVAAVQKCQSQNSLRDAWPRKYSYHPGHLQPRAPRHAGQRRQSDGRGAFVTYCCPTAAKAPGSRVRDFSWLTRVLPHCAGDSLVPEVGLEPTLPFRGTGF